MQKKPEQAGEITEILAWCKSVSKEEIQKLPFRKPVFEGIDNRFLLTQAACYQLAKKKLPAIWKEGKLIFPDKTAAEQCSAEWIAEIRLSLLPRRFQYWADTTAGLGVDSIYAAPFVSSGCLFETDAARVNCLIDNLLRLDMHLFRVEESGFEAYLEKNPDFLNGDTLVYADPDRRPEKEGGRKVSWKDSEPGLDFIYQQAKAAGAGLLVKFSPLEDLEEVLNHFPGATSSWVISIRNEVKELLVFLDPATGGPATRNFAMDIRQSHDYELIELPGFSGHLPEVRAEAAQYLLDPLAAMRKGFQSFGWAAAQGYSCISRKGQLFTASVKPAVFPGRVFRIEGVFDDLKSLLASAGHRSFHVVARGFPQSAEDLQKKFKLQGDDVHFLFAIRSGENKNVFIFAVRE